MKVVSGNQKLYIYCKNRMCCHRCPPSDVPEFLLLGGTGIRFNFFLALTFKENKSVVTDLQMTLNGW